MTSDRTQLRCEIAALDTGQLWMVLMSLVGAAPDEVRHALDDEPKGYLAWHEWAEQMSKTHRQERCPECGYWHIWVPKATP